MISTAIDQSSALVSSMLLVPTFDEHGIPATVPHLADAARTDVSTKPALTTEQGMMRAVKMGALVGIPGEFVVTGGMALLAGATPLISLVIGVFCSLWGGAYMGAIFFLPRTEEHFVRPPEWENVASFNAKAAAAAAAAAVLSA